MNPAQLLNPKAFAKEKAKANNKKPQAPVTYDPKTLLNPASRNTQQPEAAEDGEYNNGFGAGQMIENLNGITERTDIPIKKRKSQASDQTDGEDGEHKKTKTTFQAGGSGLISSHLQEERKKLVAAEPVDLTNDDEPATANEVQFIKETVSDRVCLGILHGTANVDRVPAVSQNAMRGIKGHWPKTKVEYQRVGNSQVVNLIDRSGARFGRLDLKLAGGLCPLLDGVSHHKSEFRVFLAPRERAGELPGDRVSQALKIEVLVISQRQFVERVGKFLSQKQLFLTTPIFNTGREVLNPHDQRTLYGRPTKAGNHQQQQPQTTGSGGRTVEQILRETSSMFDSLAKDEDLPERELTSTVITSPLMEHQKKALHFLMEHERSDYEELPPHSLWKFRSQANGRDAWYHLITDTVVFEKPDYIQGGILADVMGLGKTLSILSLIAETMEDARQFRREEGPEVDGEELVNAKATLIICPKSVLANWQEQIRNHTTQGDGKLRVYTYHGASRIQDLDRLSKYDIVLTSYNTAASEIHGKLNALMSINWFRVVLDEAHSIRNPSTQVSKACCALFSQRRWAMTGTPVQNSLHDLGALFRFLHLKPFDSSSTWSQYIIAPFKTGDVNVIEQLQILVRSSTLRRTKQTIDLPDKKVERVHLNFSRDEAHLYEEFARRAGLKFHGLAKGGVLKGKAYAHILKSMGQMRAICAHGKEMLNPEDMEEIRGHDESNAIVLDLGDDEADGDEFVSEKAAYDNLNTFSDSEADMCQSCGAFLIERPKEQADGEDENMSDSEDSEEIEDKEIDDSKDLLGYLTPCYHLICCKCRERHEKEVQDTLTVDNFHTCPHCQSYVKFDLYPLRQSILDRIRGERQEKGKVTAKWDEDTYSGPSTKVKELIRELEISAKESSQLPEGEPPIRSVVFSGWTQYLDLIDYALDKAQIGSTRIDGSMSVKQRSQALHTFNTIDSVRVLLVSIKAGGQGLNFTSANKVYVMEPGYNPGVEHQAVDRVHRIGQIRPVIIKHFIIRNSIEEKILALQKKKEALASMSMSNRKTKMEDAKTRMDELKDLFSIKRVI